jgi:hypothetical protein
MHHREPAIYGLAILAGMDDFGNVTNLETREVKRWPAPVARHAPSSTTASNEQILNT